MPQCLTDENIIRFPSQ